jgi:hypothetical protein
MRPKATLERGMIRCIFVRVIIKLETCHIYETVLQTIKAVIHNLSRTSNFIRNIAKLDIGILLFDRV